MALEASVLASVTTGPGCEGLLCNRHPQATPTRGGGVHASFLPAPCSTSPQTLVEVLKDLTQGDGEAANRACF